MDNLALSKMQSSDDASRLPRHIAVIMDGNGRWALKKGLPRFAGHREGLKVAEAFIKSCVAKQISVLTLFAFSSENWSRPKSEVSKLLQLFKRALDNEAVKLHEHDVQLKFIGDLSRFESELYDKMQKAETLTEKNNSLKLRIALNYGGQWDICNAVKKILSQSKQQLITNSDFTPDQFRQYLSLSDVPEPDLLIRTGGEERISNFLLWDLAYTELYFSNLLWPEFDEHAFEEAIAEFASRQRRFGKTDEQIRETL